MRQRGVRNLLDLSVITRRGVNMGDVSDVQIDPAEQRVLKLSVNWVTDLRQVYGPDMELPFSQISNFDPHQLVVADEIGETAGLDLLNFGEDGLFLNASQILDHPVRTQEGKELGTLADVFFDEDDGAIIGYEVINDRSETEHTRSLILSPSTDLELRQDVVIVPDRIKTVSVSATPDLSLREAQERQEELDYVFEADEPDKRTDEPDLDGMVPDPNEYPYGHRVGFVEEDPDSLMG
ncbi:PRC-barrel domain protein [compost metagenome]